MNKKTGYFLPAFASATTLIANTDYYFAFHSVGFTTTADTYVTTSPLTGYISQINLCLTASNNPTTEAMTLKIRINATEYTCTTSAFSGADSKLRIAVTNLNIPVTTGDSYQVKLSTPAVMVTPPANLRASALMVLRGI